MKPPVIVQIKQSLHDCVNRYQPIMP